MRSRLFALAGVSLFAAACFSSNDSGPTHEAGAPPPDAGPIVDATMPPEGSVPEAAPDTYVAEASLPEAEAGPALVTVLVHSVNGPEQGVTVVFQDAAGAVLGTATTDASGLAVHIAQGVSQATAVMGTPASPLLTTIQGVAAGDILSVYDPSLDSPTATVSIDSIPPSSPPPATASYYAQIGNCYNYAIPGSFTLAANYDCQVQGKFPVIVYAQGGADAGYANLAYSYQNGNTIPTDGGVAHVNLNGDWLLSFGSQTLNVEMEDGGIAPSVYMDEIANGVGFPDYVSNTFVDGGETTYVFPTHPGYADFLQSEAIVAQSGSYSSTLAMSAIATRGVGDSGTPSLDLNTRLPLIDFAAIDASSPAQPGVAWSSEAGSLASVDGVIAAFSWSDVTDAGTPINGRWTIVAPPTSSSVAAPALPASVSSWAPAATASFPATPLVVAVDGDFIAGYAQLRAQAGSLPISSSLVYGRVASTAPPLPADGTTIRLSAFTVNGD